MLHFLSLPVVTVIPAPALTSSFGCGLLLLFKYTIRCSGEDGSFRLFKGLKRLNADIMSFSLAFFDNFTLTHSMCPFLTATLLHCALMAKRALEILSPESLPSIFSGSVST